MSVAVEPDRVVFPHTRELVYRLTMSARDHDERFSLRLEIPFFGRGQREGMPLALLEPPRIDGPASFLGPARGAIGLPACAPSRNRFHGFDIDRRAWDVRVPANTTSVLHARFAVSRMAPWPDTSYTATFVADPRLVDGGRGTLSAPVRARPVPIVKRGISGVRIRLHTRPRGAQPTDGTPPTIRRRSRIRVYGSTRPRLVRQRLSIKYVAPGHLRPRLLRTVTTDRRGRFSASAIRLRRPGYYEIWVFYRSQRAGLGHDHSCPVTLRVR
jgi:hypothetical protein